MKELELRAQLVKLLAWHDAHVDFDGALADLPSELRGRVPPGSRYSIWQLVEHLRIAQHDILDFCINSSYKEKHWPDDYWPKHPAPKDGEWDKAIAAYGKDLAAMQALVQDETVDLFAKIPHGSGQTYLREALLVADHAAYHIGQIVLVRRLLGDWKKD
jgi:uncharacterized damage-inducible protein DinB